MNLRQLAGWPNPFQAAPANSSPSDPTKEPLQILRRHEASQMICHHFCLDLIQRVYLAQTHPSNPTNFL